MDIKKFIYSPFFIVFWPMNKFRLRKIKKVKFRNILVVGFYKGIGDFIFLSPLFRNLKQKYANPKITVLIKETMNDEFLINNPNVDRIMKLNIDRIKKTELLKYAWKELSPLKFDLVIENNWVAGFTIPFFCFLTKAKYRIGFTKSLEGFTNTVNLKSFIQPKWDGKSTYIERHLDVMKVLGQENRNLNPEIFLPQSATKFAEKFLSDNKITDSHLIMGIHVGSDISSKGRRWAIGNYIEVINKILDENKKIVILFFWGPDEKQEVQKAMKECNDGRILFINANLVNTAALIKQCHFFLSNDSMPLHLAKVFDVPTIGIFGPTNPHISYNNISDKNEKYFPIYLNLNCQPCWISPPVICKYGDFRCLNRIDPDMVIKQCEKVIRNINFSIKVR